MAATKKTTGKSIPPKSGAAKLVEKAGKAVAKVAHNVVEKAAHAVGLDDKHAKKAADLAVPSASTPTMKVHETHSFRRKLIGHVTSDKMDKTVVVEVSRYSLDRVYKKYVKHKSKYKAHDENNEYKVGDRVEIMEHRPISKEKRFKVVRLVARAALEERV